MDNWKGSISETVREGGYTLAELHFFVCEYNHVKWEIVNVCFLTSGFLTNTQKYMKIFVYVSFQPKHKLEYGFPKCLTRERFLNSALPSLWSIAARFRNGA